MRRSAAGLAAAAIVAGCGILPGPAPEWVVNRQPLESCGTETAVGVNVEARMCLLEAFEAGHGAELISTQMTEEGDPVTSYFRVHENGVVEVFSDATQDRFGSGEWERRVCDRVVPAPDDQVFVAEDCEELPVP